MLTDYNFFFETVNNAEAKVDEKLKELQVFKAELAKERRQFRSYSKKNLKEAEGAFILKKSRDCPGHYKLINTNIAVYVDGIEGSIWLYDYDRKDYFSVELSQVKSGLNVFDLSIWDSLKECEQKAIDSLIELISA